MHSHPAIELGSKATGKHVYLGIVPFMGVYSITCVTMYGIARGDKIVVVQSPEYNESVLQAIEKYKVRRCLLRIGSYGVVE